MIRAGGGLSRWKPVGPQLLIANIAVASDDLADTAHMGEIADLTGSIRNFADAREWAQFHDPKSLFIAMTGEVGEAAELLQWLPAGEAAAQLAGDDLQARWSSELADVAIYLMRLADVTQVDLAAAVRAKLAANENRYSVALARGNAHKR